MKIAHTKEEFLENVFVLDPVLQQYNGAGIVVRTEKRILDFYVDIEEFVQEVKGRNWKIFKINDQYFWYNPKKVKSLNITSICDHRLVVGETVER